MQLVRLRVTIGRLMIVVAASGCAMGLGIAGVRFWESIQPPVGVLLQGGGFVSIESGPTIVLFELPFSWLALPVLCCLVVGAPLWIYLLNRRRDRRRNTRP
jgi:hypothetical protein